MGVDKVLSVFGIFFVEDPLVFFSLRVYWHMENNTNTEILSKIYWRWNLSL